MATSIPINQKISVTPAVISAGNGINHLSGLIITLGTNVVADKTVKAYNSATAVGNDFGTTSTEYAMAQVYFTGTTLAPIPPATLYIAGHMGGLSIDATYLNTIARQAPFSVLATTFPSEINERLAIAAWVNQTQLYLYAAWDKDTAETAIGDTTSFGVQIRNQKLSGTVAIYDTTPMGAALVMAWACSTNFDQTNGRSTLAYRSNSYVSPVVSDGTLASTLEQNAYNYYGNFANGSSGWQFFQPGSVSGQFLWADSYINQIWMNTNFQINLIDLETGIGQIPFNTEGDNLIAGSLQTTIDAALNFGAIRAGVTLSSSEAQSVNSLAGNTTAASTLQTRGWYLIPGASTASATVRSARGPIRPIFIYTDGQSVHTINMLSTEVQ